MILRGFTANPFTNFFYEDFTKFLPRIFTKKFYQVFTKFFLPNFYELFTKNFYEVFTKFLLNPEILNLKIQIQASEIESGDENSDAEIENADPDENASESEFMQILMKIHQMNMHMKFHHLMQIKIHASEIESVISSGDADENSS